MYVRVILKIGRRPANFISQVNKTYHKSQVAAERLVSLKVKVVGWLTRVYLHVVWAGNFELKQWAQRLMTLHLNLWLFPRCKNFKDIGAPMTQNANQLISVSMRSAHDTKCKSNYFCSDFNLYFVFSGWFSIRCKQKFQTRSLWGTLMRSRCYQISCCLRSCSSADEQLKIRLHLKVIFCLHC